MCHAVYIWTNKKEKITNFIHGETFLYLQELDKDEEKWLKDKFSKKYIYYVWAYTWCSCWFVLDEENSLEEEIKSTKELLKLINKLTKDDSLEFFACWEWEWEDKINKKSILEIDNISLKDFSSLSFFDKHFIKFEKQNKEI